MHMTVLTSHLLAQFQHFAQLAADCLRNALVLRPGIVKSRPRTKGSDQDLNQGSGLDHHVAYASLSETAYGRDTRR